MAIVAHRISTNFLSLDGNVCVRVRLRDREWEDTMDPYRTETQQSLAMLLVPGLAPALGYERPSWDSQRMTSCPQLMT